MSAKSFEVAAQKARQLIGAELDGCRKPNAAAIAEQTDLSFAQVTALIDQVTAARAARLRIARQPAAAVVEPVTPQPPSPNLAPNAPPAASSFGAQLDEQLRVWQSHQNPKVQAAAARCATAWADAQAAVIAAEAQAKLLQRRDKLRQQLQAVQAELAGGGQTCPDCGQRLRSASPQSLVVHRRRSPKHRAA